MPKRIVFVLFVFISGGSVFANMRAPYFQWYRSSQVLKISGNECTVLSEKIVFECEVPAKGKLSSVIDKTFRSRVEAEYAVQSDEKQNVRLDFILPSKTPLGISVNGLTVPCDPPVLIEEGGEHGFHARDTTLYHAEFSAGLIKGVNSIKVMYSQPMNVNETEYGYFTKSRYSTWCEYELWPLKEWKRSKDFTLTITVRVADDTGLSKIVFGSDYSIAIRGTDNDDNRLPSKSKPVFEKYNLETNRDTLEYMTIYKTEFPDIITIAIE